MSKHFFDYDHGRILTDSTQSRQKQSNCKIEDSTRCIMLCIYGSLFTTFVTCSRILFICPTYAIWPVTFVCPAYRFTCRE